MSRVGLSQTKGCKYSPNEAVNVRACSSPSILSKIAVTGHKAEKIVAQRSGAPNPRRNMDKIAAMLERAEQEEAEEEEEEEAPAPWLLKRNSGEEPQTIVVITVLTTTTATTTATAATTSTTTTTGDPEEVAVGPGFLRTHFLYHIYILTSSNT